MLHSNSINKDYSVGYIKDMEETERFQQEKNGGESLTRRWRRLEWTEHRVKRGALLYWAVLLMGGAGIIHLAGVLLQPTQSGAIAAALLCAAVVQIVVALIIVRVPARRFLLTAAAIEGCATLLWTIAHTSGFPVGSIDYELAPFYRVVDEIKEAKCAVRFLRAHAGELGIDPQRIGVYGPSQGGYISAMLGTAGPQAGFDEGQYLNQSSSVQAVVDMFGPTDLNNFSGSPSWVGTLKQAIGGGKGSVASLRKLSPINYVAPGDAPFLIIHGTDDWFIAPHHSQDMAKRLSAEGVPVQLVMVQHNSHGIAAPIAGQIEQPSPDELVQMITSFFVKTLRTGAQ